MNAKIPHESVVSVLAALSKKSPQVVERTWELTAQVHKGPMTILQKTATALKIKFKPFSAEIGDRIRRGRGSVTILAISRHEILAESADGSQIIYPLTYPLLNNIG